MDRNVASIAVSAATAAACLRVREAHWLDLRHFSSGTKVEASAGASSGGEAEEEVEVEVEAFAWLPSSPASPSPLPSSPSPWPHVPFCFSPSSFFSKGRAIAGCHLPFRETKWNGENGLREREKSEFFLGGGKGFLLRKLK